MVIWYKVLERGKMNAKHTEYVLAMVLHGAEKIEVRDYIVLYFEKEFPEKLTREGWQKYLGNKESFKKEIIKVLKEGSK